jgi:hypothetical protein
MRGQIFWLSMFLVAAVITFFLLLVMSVMQMEQKIPVVGKRLLPRMDIKVKEVVEGPSRAEIGLSAFLELSAELTAPVEVRNVHDVIFIYYNFPSKQGDARPVLEQKLQEFFINNRAVLILDGEEIDNNIPTPTDGKYEEVERKIALPQGDTREVTLQLWD